MPSQVTSGATVLSMSIEQPTQATLAVSSQSESGPGLGAVLSQASPPSATQMALSTTTVFMPCTSSQTQKSSPGSCASSPGQSVAGASDGTSTHTSSPGSMVPKASLSMPMCASCTSTSSTADGRSDGSAPVSPVLVTQIS